MTEYEKLLKLEEAYPDYTQHEYLVCRRFSHSEVGDALSDYLRNGATVCKDDAALTDDRWNRTYTQEEFNAGFKVVGIKCHSALKSHEKRLTALFRHGATWRDADGWRWSAREDGLFENGICGVVYELANRISEDFILVQ